MSSDELKSCPRCGSDAVRLLSMRVNPPVGAAFLFYNAWSVYCTNCHLGTKQIPYPAIDMMHGRRERMEAIRIWNDLKREDTT